MTTNAPDDLLDPAIIESLRELGDDDFSLTELRATFTDTVSATIEEIQEAVDKEDGAAVSALAHRLKGSAGTMGAHRMAVMCRQLESHAHGQLDGAAAAVTLEKLRGEFKDVVLALAEALPDRPRSG